MTDKHDKLVEMARECGFSLVTNEGYQPTPAKLAAFRDRIVASLCADVEPFVFEEYPYHYEAMGCGLEDRNITDRYEAMAYGWERAMERAAEAIPDDLYPASTVASLTAQRDAALARVAELEAALRTADHTFAQNGILASHAARQEIQAALTKGQP